MAEATAVRPVDDVCPWDAAPGPNSETLPDIAAPNLLSSGIGGLSFDHGLSQPHDYRSSRKNSSQLDSCSSSSDISIAIAEVSERLHKFPFPCSSSSGNNERATTTTTTTATITRNYSISSISGRVKLADTSRPSVSSYTCSSPQQSIDLPSSSHNVGDFGSSAIAVSRIQPREDFDLQVRSGGKFTSASSSSFSTTATMATTVKSPGLAPLISISAIVGDLSGDAFDSELDSVAGGDDGGGGGSSFECVSREEQATQTSCRQVDVDVQKNENDGVEMEETNEEDVNDVRKITSQVQSELLVTEEGAEEAQVVPVWDPDTQQDPTNAPTAAAAITTTTTTQEQRDNNVNEVCPWEDE